MNAHFKTIEVTARIFLAIAVMLNHSHLMLLQAQAEEYWLVPLITIFVGLLAGVILVKDLFKETPENQSKGK